jgi:TolB-like protein
VFSREVNRLSETQSVDFFISGTITEQQEGAIVNARVIHVKTKDVVAAATKFIPADVFWQREKVSKRNGLIYRTSSK